MPLTNPLLNLQPAFLARITLNLPHTHPCHLLIQRFHPPPQIQPVVLALEPTSTILPTPMPIARLRPNLQPALLHWNQPQKSYPHQCQLPIYFLTSNMFFLPRNKPQLSYPHPSHLLIQQFIPPPHLKTVLLASESTSNILSKPKPLDHPPPNLQPVLLALEPTSPILSTSLQLAYPPANLQPALLARTALHYPIHTPATCSSSNHIHLQT